MSDFVLPVLFAVFVWWFSTGAVIFLDGLKPRTFGWSLLGATLLLAAALIGLGVSAQDTSTAGAYCAFTCGLLIWAWHELSYYTGYVTGPRPVACPPDATAWRRFVCALQACLWHELAIVVTAGAIVSITWGAPNQIGTWTFVILWWMHESARLNVLLGVRNLAEEFFPDHLAYLKSYVRRRPMNFLFPWSVSISTAAAVLLFAHAAAAPDGHSTAAGYVLLGTLMTVAIIEHWMLMLPMPFAALWRWYLRSRKTTTAYRMSPDRGAKLPGLAAALRTARTLGGRP